MSQRYRTATGTHLPRGTVSNNLVTIKLMSRVLPLRPLVHQAARYGAHLSPSLPVPARHQTHLDSITSLITFPIYFTPFGSFPRRYCFCVMSVRCSCFLFCIMLCSFIKTLTPWTWFPTLSAHRYIHGQVLARFGSYISLSLWGVCPLKNKLYVSIFLKVPF